MNCQDIGRILDSGKYGALSVTERREAEAHAHTCMHCAPRWGVHSRLAAMPIPAMPPDFAKQCQALVAARARSNVIRFVPRTLIVASGFVVLAAAAAVVTVKYNFLVRHRDVAAIPVELLAPVQSEPVIQAPALPPAGGMALQPDKTIQQTVQGETDMNRTSSIAVAVAAMGVAATAPAQTATNNMQVVPDVIASNDLNKDGQVTKEEATTANKSLIKMWTLFDMDSDGIVTIVEATRATEEMLVATAEEKITGEKKAGPAMVKPSDAITTNDLNKDGVVTKEEAMTVGKGLARLWNNYDLNKDGKVDAAEFAKAQGY